MIDLPHDPIAPATFEMSAEIGEIAKVLPKAQAAMGDVFKNANNPAFRSKYADLAAVVEAVVPALNANGIALMQPSNYDGEFVRVSTMLVHESGQWVKATLAIPLSKRDAHGVGSAVTYGRRFGLQAMSGVAPTDDDGNQAAGRDGNAASGKREQAEPAAPMMARKSSAQAKKDGDHERILAKIHSHTSEEVLDLWYRQRFDEETKDVPYAWLDAFRNEVEKHREAIRSGDFRQAPDGSVSGRNVEREIA